jgi:hypothetical protein
MSYATATGPRLSSRDALRAVFEYAEEFVETGDVDVLFTLSGGAIMDDGNTVDAAIWCDWAEAWQRAAPQAHTESGDVDSALTMQHGYRAFHVFLDRHYQPVDHTLMSVVRDDCRRALTVGDDMVWDNWRQSVEDGESEDIAFRLSGWSMLLERVLDVEFLLRKGWWRITRRDAT